jgi:sulfatase maturation enzyme AslB (radical SAM superfamily)
LLNQGVELPGCKVCWDDEKQNKISYRLSAGQISESSNRVEIFLSNLCNQMCSYCSPNYSSVWEESINKLGNFKQVSNTAIKNLQISTTTQSVQARMEEIQAYIQSCDDHSVLLELLGGEPLMQIHNLKRLLEFSPTKIKNLQIATNLNPPNSKFLEWVLTNFPKEKLTFNISLDATPEFNHVPRAGFDSIKFLKNLDLLTHRQIKINFTSVVSATSIFDLSKFLNWTNIHGYSANFVSLNNPSCLNPEFVPIDIRQEILKTIQTEIPPVLYNVLNHQQPMVDLKLFEQYNYLIQYFTRTNTDLTKINNPLFQEYWQWLTEKFKR